MSDEPKIPTSKIISLLLKAHFVGVFFTTICICFFVFISGDAAENLPLLNLIFQGLFFAFMISSIIVLPSFLFVLPCIAMGVLTSKTLVDNNMMNPLYWATLSTIWATLWCLALGPEAWFGIIYAPIIGLLMWTEVRRELAKRNPPSNHKHSKLRALSDKIISYTR